jgi:hypothetical protein
MTLLDPEGCCASTVNKVLKEHAPIDLIASVQQYCHYRDTQYHIQATANHLRKKEMQYLKKTMEVLSGLENANILGRIMAHNDVMMQELTETAGAVPHYLGIIKKFKGEVTKSAADTTINPLFSLSHPSAPLTIQKPPSSPRKECKAGLFQKKPTLKRHPQMMVYHRDHLPRDPRHVDWRCHCCRLLGHIRRDCPTRRIPRK